jgi:hypothetical protein
VDQRTELVLVNHNHIEIGVVDRKNRRRRSRIEYRPCTGQLCGLIKRRN